MTIGGDLSLQEQFILHDFIGMSCVASTVFLNCVLLYIDT